MTLSVVIPTLNEAGYLNKTIAHLIHAANQPDHLEIIIVDAGSNDHTLRSIKSRNCQVYSRPDFVLKKYKSLNFGLRKSTGEVVLFLDADTLVPENFDAHILGVLEKPEVVGGAFEFDFKDRSFFLWLIAMANRIRYRIEQSYYGDQAVFCRRKVALKMGGYPEKSLMESAYFCRKLREQGKLRLINKSVKTSARRFIEHGILKVLWFDFRMWIRFLMRMNVQRFGKKYWCQEH